MFSSEQEHSTNTIIEVAELKVPEDLTPPAKPGKYDVPMGSNTASTISDRSPSLILPTAQSSRVDEGEKQARVRFDRTDVTGDLISFLQQVLQKQFAEQNVDLTAVDDANLIYTTGWINTHVEEGFWFWSNNSVAERARYTITIDAKPHGRSANLEVKMLEHEYFSSKAKLTEHIRKTQEVALLNSIIDRVSKEEIIISQKNKAKAPEVNLEPGIDKLGNAALITPQKLDVTWSQLEGVFEALQLNVTDKDRSKSTYFVRYENEKPSFWSSLWSSKAEIKLPLNAGEYQVVLAKQDQGTAIVFKDKDGEVLSADAVLGLYPSFVTAIKNTRIEL